MIPPGAKVIPILGVQCFCGIAMQQIAALVALAIGSPTGIRPREAGDPQAGAHPVKHVIELALLACTQGSREHLMCSLGVIDEHVEHIAVGPIRDVLTSLALDCLVNRSDSIERARSSRYVGEDNLLSI